MSELRVVYVHGIHGKPAEAVYLAEWDAAVRRLAYIREIKSTMMYWSDIRLGITPDMVREAHDRAHKLGSIASTACGRRRTARSVMRSRSSFMRSIR